SRHKTRHGNPRRSRTTRTEPTRLDRHQLRRTTAAFRSNKRNQRDKTARLDQRELCTSPRGGMRMLAANRRISSSHVRLPHGTPTCDSYVRTYGRTNEEPTHLYTSSRLT